MRAAMRHLCRSAQLPLQRFIFSAAAVSSITQRLRAPAAPQLPCRSAHRTAIVPITVSSISDQVRTFSSDERSSHTQPENNTLSTNSNNNTNSNETDADDDLTVQLFRPHLSPEETERKLKTELFLCLLLTLPRAQDWRDMLAAALRAHTWQPRHLDAVLRGVLLNKYNEPQGWMRGGCGYASALQSNAALRDAAVEAAQSAPLTSSPTHRLRRARDIVVFCAEEGSLYRSGTVADSTCSVAPSPAAVHHLLAMLLQAAQRGAEQGLHSSTPSADPEGSVCDSRHQRDVAALPIASFAEVWHFLAWMELRGYHVLSNAVLDALESAVDEGGNTSQASGSAPAGNADGEAGQYAMVSQRIHRLDYVRSERALLREAARKSMMLQGASLGKEGQDSSSLRRRRDDIPRTDPSSTG